MTSDDHYTCPTCHQTWSLQGDQPTHRQECFALAQPEPLDVAYRERNAVVAALIRTNGWPRWVAMAPDADGWIIVYAETPEGQVSWHVGPDDFDLFADFPDIAPGGWDGHTTEEKYERLARLSETPR